MNMPIAAPNINKVANETTATLARELGCPFIRVESKAAKMIQRRRKGASNPLMMAVK